MNEREKPEILLKPIHKINLLRSEYHERILAEDEKRGLEAKREAYMDALIEREQALANWHAWSFAFKNLGIESNLPSDANTDFALLEESARALERAKDAYELALTDSTNEAYSPTPEALLEFLNA